MSYFTFPSCHGFPRMLGTTIPRLKGSVTVSVWHKIGTWSLVALVTYNTQGKPVYSWT